MHKSDINARSNKRWNILFNAVKQYEGGERLRERMTGKMNLKAIEKWKKSTMIKTNNLKNDIIEMQTINLN